MNAVQCAVAGCLRIAEPEGRCLSHIADARRKAGLCANCGGEREQRPVMNQLTGKQLRRNGSPAYKWVCKGCGRTQTERARPLL